MIQQIGPAGVRETGNVGDRDTRQFQWFVERETELAEGSRSLLHRGLQDDVWTGSIDLKTAAKGEAVESLQITESRPRKRVMVRPFSVRDVNHKFYGLAVEQFNSRYRRSTVQIQIGSLNAVELNRFREGQRERGWGSSHLLAVGRICGNDPGCRSVDTRCSAECQGIFTDLVRADQHRIDTGTAGRNDVSKARIAAIGGRVVVVGNNESERIVQFQQGIDRVFEGSRTVPWRQRLQRQNVSHVGFKAIEVVSPRHAQGGSGDGGGQIVSARATAICTSDDVVVSIRIRETGPFKMRIQSEKVIVGSQQCSGAVVQVQVRVADPVIDLVQDQLIAG